MLGPAGTTAKFGTFARNVTRNLFRISPAMPPVYRPAERVPRYGNEMRNKFRVTKREARNKFRVAGRTPIVSRTGTVIKEHVLQEGAGHGSASPDFGTPLGSGPPLGT